MSQIFKIKVNDFYEFNFTEDSIKDLDLSITNDKHYHVLKENQSFDAQINTINFNKKNYTIEVNGNSYVIKIFNALDLLITDLGLEATSSEKNNEVMAPMPGLIVSVDVTEGQVVKEGEGMLVLEAMKMENMLAAPKDGTVKTITVEAGDKVEKNALLIELE